MRPEQAPPTKGHTWNENWLSLPQQQSTINSSSGSGGFQEPPSVCWNVDWRVTTVAVSSEAQSLSLVQNALFALILFDVWLLLSFLVPGAGRCTWYRCPIYSCHSQNLKRKKKNPQLKQQRSLVEAWVGLHHYIFLNMNHLTGVGMCNWRLHVK